MKKSLSLPHRRVYWGVTVNNKRRYNMAAELAALRAQVAQLTVDVAASNDALASVLDDVVGAYTTRPAHTPFLQEQWDRMNRAMDKAKAVLATERRATP